MKKNILVLTLLVIVLHPSNGQPFKNSSIGVGIGVPYGALGLNTEVALQKHLSVSAGIGTTIFAGTGYAVGARAYLGKPDATWRPRLSAHYGINSIIKLDKQSDGQKFSGLSLGAGLLGMFGGKIRNGIDVEIIYLATTGGLEDEIERLNNSGTFSHIDTPGKIKLLLGYRIGF